MNWVLVTLWLSAQTGDVVKVDPPVPIDVAMCFEVGLPALVKDGLVPVHVCRQVDTDGKPIPEDKIDPSKPEAPKVTT